MVIAARQKITQEKWPEILDSFELHISVLVLQEAEQGDADAAQRRIAAVTNMPILSVSDEAERIASLLIRNGPIPREFPEDALHIAIATVNGMDYLLTWNFTHINNAQMKAKIIAVIEAEGYQCPTLCSPEELLGE
ncbi:MAG: type II toxin-antitoxin system VapC family toxin [bacterium]